MEQRKFSNMIKLYIAMRKDYIADGQMVLAKRLTPIISNLKRNSYEQRYNKAKFQPFR